MSKTCRLSAFGFATAAMIVSLGLHAQVGDPPTLIKEKMITDFKLTKTTAAHDDVVTAGDVVVLHKDGLMMCSSASSYAYSNTYQNGVLMSNQKNRAKDAASSFLKGHLPFGGGGSATDAANNGCESRKFVAGEKFFIYDIKNQKDGIVVDTISDPYNDVRYYGELKFMFPKSGVTPPLDEFLKTVREVLTVEQSDDKGDKGGGNDQAKEAPAAAPAAAAPAAEPAAPLQAIAPPPPPADAPPPTVEVGETKDQVVAGFGQPTRILKPSAIKEIYVYKDMKVTFIKGKVSTIE